MNCVSSLKIKVVEATTGIKMKAGLCIYPKSFAKRPDFSSFRDIYIKEGERAGTEIEFVEEDKAYWKIIDNIKVLNFVYFLGENAYLRNLCESLLIPAYPNEDEAKILSDYRLLKLVISTYRIPVANTLFVKPEAGAKVIDSIRDKVGFPADIFPLDGGRKRIYVESEMEALHALKQFKGKDFVVIQNKIEGKRIRLLSTYEGSKLVLEEKDGKWVNIKLNPLLVTKLESLAQKVVDATCGTLQYVQFNITNDEIYFEDCFVANDIFQRQMDGEDALVNFEIYAYADDSYDRQVAFSSDKNRRGKRIIAYLNEKLEEE